MADKPYMLPATEVQSLIENRRKLEFALAEANRAESCDIDCQQDKSDAELAIRKIDRLLEVYAPNTAAKAVQR